MGSLTFEDLRKAAYLDAAQLGDRIVNLMPLWDGTEWRMWFPRQGGLLETKPQDTTEVDHAAHAPAKPSDPFIPFVHLRWQRATGRET